MHIVILIAHAWGAVRGPLKLLPVQGRVRSRCKQGAFGSVPVSPRCAIGHIPARKGCRGMRRAAQLVHTRCGVPSWNLGGSSMRAALQGAQKMLPHRRQWCRVRRRDLQR